MLPFLMTIPLLLASVAAPTDALAEQAQEEFEACVGADRGALIAFERSVNDYVDLHRRLARLTPRLQVTADPEQLREAVDTLGLAIQTARLNARRGEFFTDPAADLFRRRVLRALGGLDVRMLMAEMDEDAETDETMPVVNGPFPWSSGNAIWPSVLYALPRLPEELEYRFIGPDLVLLDLPANLVIDVLENALPN